MKRNRRSVKIQDVARAAGVSVSTVSRVLNEKDDVSTETYDRVQRVISELGYASSLAARGMRSHRTNLIGLIMPDVADPYNIEVLRGVNQAISESDFDLIIYTSARSWNYGAAEYEMRYVMLLNGSIADGTVVVAPTALDFSAHAPLVIIDPNHESPNLPAIISTNREGVGEAMAYLVGLGHRRIAHITGRPDLVSSSQRLQGYKDGLAAAGIELDETLIQYGDYTTETAYRCARTLLALKDRPTAIFAANDMSAIGVYQAAEQAGVCIPRELSVVGFDNISESAFMKPALTTVDQFISKMAIQATELVIRLIKGETLENTQFKFPTRLLLRESCCSPASRL